MQGLIKIAWKKYIKVTSRIYKPGTGSLTNSGSKCRKSNCPLWNGENHKLSSTLNFDWNALFSWYIQFNKKKSLGLLLDDPDRIN